MYVPLLPSRWLSKLDCAGMLELLPSRKDISLVPWAVSAEFVGFSVEASKCRARRMTLSTSRNLSSSSAAMEPSLA
jgi:hypothetical protein